MDPRVHHLQFRVELGVARVQHICQQSQVIQVTVVDHLVILVRQF